MRAAFFVARRSDQGGYLRASGHAELVREWNTWRSKYRWRCQACSKVAYRRGDVARDRAMRISERQPMKAYFQPKCGWWHLTRIKRGR